MGSIIYVRGLADLTPKSERIADASDKLNGCADFQSAVERGSVTSFGPDPSFTYQEVRSVGPKRTSDCCSGTFLDLGVLSTSFRTSLYNWNCSQKVAEINSDFVVFRRLFFSSQIAQICGSPPPPPPLPKKKILLMLFGQVAKLTPYAEFTWYVWSRD